MVTLKLGQEEAITEVTRPKVLLENVLEFSAGYYHIAVITTDKKVLTCGERGSRLGRPGEGFGFSEVQIPDTIENPENVACGANVTMIRCGNTNNVAIAGTGEKGDLGLGR